MPASPENGDAPFTGPAKPPRRPARQPPASPNDHPVPEHPRQHAPGRVQGGCGHPSVPAVPAKARVSQVRTGTALRVSQIRHTVYRPWCPRRRPRPSLKGSALHISHTHCFTEAGECLSIHRDIQYTHARRLTLYFCFTTNSTRATNRSCGSGTTTTSRGALRLRPPPRVTFPCEGCEARREVRYGR